MTTSLYDRDVYHTGQKKPVSHLIVVTLRRGEQPDFAQEVSGFIDILSVMQGCTRYELHAHPVESHTWLIQGDWSCPLAMVEHFRSEPLQGLISHLRFLLAYRVEFSCQGLDS